MFRLALVLVLVAAACTATPTPAPTTTEPPGATTTTTPLEPAVVSPPGRRGHGMVATAGRLVVFGGRTILGGARHYLADTWAWDPIAAVWDGGLDGDGPGQRSQFAMASSDERVVLFGGYTGTSFTYGDTWSLDTADGIWDRPALDDAPTARAGAAMAYDSESGAFVLFGGAERPPVAELPLSETWVLRDGSDAWERRPGTGPVLLNEGHPTLFETAMTYDTESDRIVLLIGGHDLWVYDENTDTWEPRTAPAGFDADYMVAAAYHAGIDRVVTYGGAPTGSTGETWLYDVNTDTWTQALTDHDPGPIGDHAMAYLPVTDRVYLFGGGTDLLPLDGLGDVSSAMWDFDGTDWSPVAGIEE